MNGSRNGLPVQDNLGGEGMKAMKFKVELGNGVFRERVLPVGTARRAVRV